MLSTKQIVYNFVMVSIFITLIILFVFSIYHWVRINITNEQMIKTNCTIVDYPLQLDYSTGYINISYQHNGRIFDGSIIIRSNDYIKLEQKLVKLYVNNITIDCYYDIFDPTIIYWYLLDGHVYFIACILCSSIIIFGIPICMLLQIKFLENNKLDEIVKKLDEIDKINITSTVNKHGYLEFKD